MLEKLKSYLNTLKDQYFIQINYVELEKGGTVPVLKDKQFLIYNKDESVDYTKDVQIATPFGFMLGCIVVNRLKKESANYPNLQFELISIGDARFINDIFGPQKTGFEAIKQPVDIAADELGKKYLQNDNVIAIGSHHKVDAEKKIHDVWIEVHVKDERAKTALQNHFANNKYKDFLVKVIVSKPVVAQPKK